MSHWSEGDSPTFAAEKRRIALEETYATLRKSYGFWRTVAHLTNLGVSMEEIQPVAEAAGDLAPGEGRRARG